MKKAFIALAALLVAVLAALVVLFWPKDISDYYVTTESGSNEIIFGVLSEFEWNKNLTSTQIDDFFADRERRIVDVADSVDVFNGLEGKVKDVEITDSLVTIEIKLDGISTTGTGCTLVCKYKIKSDNDRILLISKKLSKESPIVFDAKIMTVNGELLQNALDIKVGLSDSKDIIQAVDPSFLSELVDIKQ